LTQEHHIHILDPQLGKFIPKALSKGVAMEYVRKVDFAAIEKSGADERLTQKLFDHTSGATTCTINCIKTPAAGGSPAGMHVHDVDQIFYILSGTMSIEIEGKQYDCSPGSLIIFPVGVRHRNWNGGSEPTVHLAFNTPLPDPNAPFAKSV
jgi:mannose-6-phosphate isomerase-like protein (cupin superfamily)